jgi:MFS family permease
VLPIALALALITIPYTANKSFLVSYVESVKVDVRPELFFSIYAVALVLLRMALRKQYDKVSYPKFLLLCSISIVGALLSLHFMRSSWLILIGAIFMAGGYGIMYSVSQSATAAVAPADQRGIAMGTFYLGLDFGSALGPIIGGFLYGNVDLQFFYPLLGVFVMGCIGMYFYCRKIYP